MTEDHPVAPLGEYGLSKLKTEELAAEWRKRGMSISMFRPRLIIGPGRLGILEKLFKLIDYNLPVPMIGSGKNPYQFISVFDCAEAARLAFKAGVPNEAYNLGSHNPPPVQEAARRPDPHAGSRSLLVPTPGWAVKRTLDLLDLLNLPIMDPEQYLIADEIACSTSSRPKRELGWVPQYRDEDMLIAAYKEYRAKKDGHTVARHTTCRPNRRGPDDHHDQAGRRRAPHRRCRPGACAGGVTSRTFSPSRTPRRSTSRA